MVSPKVLPAGRAIKRGRAVTYEFGKTYPLDYTRGVVGARMDHPQWFAVTVPGMKERAVSEYLKQKGVHSCFPEREKSWVIRGKRHRRKYPVIAGIVYAKFRHAPQWDVLKARKLITGVFSYGSNPIVIPPDIVRAVMGLPTREDELRKAQRELMRIREGDRAEIVSGPLDGLLVDVRKVERGRVWFETLSGIKGETSVDDLSRKIY